MCEANILLAQREVCARYGATHFPSHSKMKVGISRNVRDGLMPLNGLRHPQEGDTTGWYIWAGEDFSHDPGFFVPLHVDHLVDWCPLVCRFLGLPPGWRFLVTRDYEDVWEDESLLNIIDR